jgi:hypothetical protein
MYVEAEEDYVPTDKAGVFLVIPPNAADFFKKWNEMNGRIVLAQELLSRKGSLDNDETRKTIEDAYIERKACHNKLLSTLVAPEINLGRGTSWLVCIPAGVIGIEVWDGKDFDIEVEFLNEQKIVFIAENFDGAKMDDDKIWYSDTEKEKAQSEKAKACLEGYKREMYRLYQPNAKK